MSAQMAYIDLRKVELCASSLNTSMHTSAQSRQIGQQLKGFPSLMHTDTQFSQLAAQFMRISMLSVYFLTGVFTMIFFGINAITIPSTIDSRQSTKGEFTFLDCRLSILDCRLSTYLSS